MAFLTDDDFEDLPDDDGDAFVKLSDISRKRLMASPTDRDGELMFEDLVGYMNEVSALAEQFNIPDVSYDRDFNVNANAEFAMFTRAVEYRTVQIRARRARRERRNSVALSGQGRERIQHYLEKLKAEV